MSDNFTFFDFAKELCVYNEEELLNIKKHQEENFEKSLAEIMKIICRSENIKSSLSIHKKYNVYPLNDSFSMKRGLEVFRIVYSNIAANLRNANKEYLNKGILIYNNIFDSTVHKNIKKEIESFPLRVNSNNLNIVSNKKNTQLYKSIFSNEIKQIIFDAIGLNAESQFNSTTFVQRLNKNSEAHVIEKNGEDAQYRYHADIFAPSLKWWYFPDEVKEEHGPLCYAEKTCSLNKNILKWWYEETLKITSNQYIPEWKNPGHSEGSPRIEIDKLKEMGYDMKKMICEPNTLIIANVHGFHCRGKPQNWEKNIRNAVHGSIRCEPFRTSR